MMALEGVAAPDDCAESMESKSHGQQKQSHDCTRGVECLAHWVSDTDDIKGRGVNIHVASVLGAGRMEGSDYVYHVSFMFEIAEVAYFHGKIRRDPDSMAAIVAPELGPFLDILPHVGVIVEVNPGHFSVAHGFTNRLSLESNHVAIPCVGILYQ